MRKLMAGAAAIAAVLMVSGTTAFAAPITGVHNYVDANGDGICDYCSASCAFVDANGDGICDNYTGSCIGAGYMDVNGDGICDNYGNCGMGTGRHHGGYGGHGHRGGWHH